MALHRRARAIQRQFEQGLLAAQLRRPVGQLPVLFTGFHPVALPEGVVGILDRQRRQRRRLPLAETDVERDQFIHHDLHRPAIGDDVVLGQDQHMVILGHLQQANPEQRPGQQIEQLPGLGLDEVLHGRLDLPFARLGRQCLAQQFQARLGGDHLQRRVGLLDKMRAQAFMAGDQAVEAALQGLDVQLPAQAQGLGNVIGGALGRQLPEEPLALLGIGQRQALLAQAHLGNRQVGRGDALFEHLLQVDLALLQGQQDEAFDNFQRGGVVHYTASISSSNSSSALRSAPCTCPGVCCNWLTNSPRVGNSNAICTLTWRPSLSWTRETIAVTNKECPPSSKKLSFMPTCSTSSTWAQIAATCCSSSLCGAM